MSHYQQLPADDEGAYLTFSGLAQDVPAGGGGTRRVLRDVTGYVQPGTLLAVMGPSGSGKTTLLDLLGGRSAPAQGRLLMNGYEYSPSVLRRTGFVPQQDRLFATLTARESLEFSARLRLPESVSAGQRSQAVDDAIAELGLLKVQHSLVGGAQRRGLSGGETKRVSIGVELVHDPQLLLLDEPSSGLDSATALRVVLLLRRLASRRRRTVVATIHAPSSRMFAAFDQLLLLAEGRVVYFGAAQGAVAAFEAQGLALPPQSNPSDWFLDLVSPPAAPDGDEEDGGGGIAHVPVADLARAFAESEQGRRAAAKVALVDSGDRDRVPSLPAHRLGALVDDDATYATGFVTQFRVLTARAFLNARRNPMSSFVALARSLFMALLVGVLYFQMSLGPEGFQDRTGVIFYVVLNQCFSASSLLRVFLEERAIFEHERKNRAYSVGAYFWGKTVSELPLSMCVAAVFASVAYWMVGFQAEAGKFLAFLATIVAVTLAAESYAQAIGAVVRDARTAEVLCPVGLALSTLFGGAFINFDSIPGYLRWLQWASMFKYANAALCENEISGLVFTGGAWSTGAEALASLNLGSLGIAGNVGGLLALLGAYKVLAYWGLVRRS